MVVDRTISIDKGLNTGRFVLSHDSIKLTHVHTRHLSRLFVLKIAHERKYLCRFMRAIREGQVRRIQALISLDRDQGPQVGRAMARFISRLVDLAQDPSEHLLQQLEGCWFEPSKHMSNQWASLSESLRREFFQVRLGRANTLNLNCPGPTSVVFWLLVLRRWQTH
jgi:hypothetical protein